VRIHAAHDAQGSVQHIVICPPDAPCATVTAQTGLFVSEIEPPEAISGVDLSDPEGSRRQLAEVLQHLEGFRVEVEAEARLVRRSSEVS
jgi:hypothetical protein